MSCSADRATVLVVIAGLVALVLLLLGALIHVAFETGADSLRCEGRSYRALAGGVF